MIHTIGVYLLFGAVALRALVVFAGDPQLPLVMALLAAFGLGLFAGPRLIRGSRERSAGAGLAGGGDRQAWREAVLPAAYLLVQTGLVTALLFIPATEDFMANLFIILSMDAVMYLGWRGGLAAIAAFSLITAAALGSSAQGPLFAVVMAALYGGVGLLFGRYALQMQRAEAAGRDNQRLAAELETAHGQLRRYVSQTEEMAAEQEQARLARELHDSVTQTVFSMNLVAQGAGLLLIREPGRVAGELERLEELAAGAMREIQALVSQLLPAFEAVESLPEGLRRLVAAPRTAGAPRAAAPAVAPLSAMDGLQVSLDVIGERKLSTAEVAGLYAIAQEALNNVSKHAGTGRAAVRLNLAESGACLEIEDSGPGFDPTKTPPAGHLGLAAMAERASEIGWKLTIDAVEGRGTRIRVEERPRERTE